MATSLPKFISVDDHIVEPPDLFLDALPQKYRDRAPRVERKRGRLSGPGESRVSFIEEKENPEASWADVWVYDDLMWPLTAGYAAIGTLRTREALTLVTYEDIELSCYDRDERLRAMDANHTEASLCFPTMPRFCGQHFLERQDKVFAMLCLSAYNDWILDYWCGGPARGRLIPVIVIPLWDPVLAATEVRRCAKKGARAISFSECPPHLGLPSIHSGHWDPLFAACNDEDIVVNLHIGTSSRMPITSADAPQMVTIALTFLNSQSAAVDWLASGLFERFKDLRIALSEGQVGWLPFVLDRIDSIWQRAELYEENMHQRLPTRPSELAASHVFGCLFDDIVGLRNRESLGIEQLMFEVDFPHADSTYPNTLPLAEGLVAAADLNDGETTALFRGNAIRCYRLREMGLQ